MKAFENVFLGEVMKKIYKEQKKLDRAYKKGKVSEKAYIRSVKVLDKAFFDCVECMLQNKVEEDEA